MAEPRPKGPRPKKAETARVIAVGVSASAMFGIVTALAVADRSHAPSTLAPTSVPSAHASAADQPPVTVDQIIVRDHEAQNDPASAPASSPFSVRAATPAAPSPNATTTSAGS